MNPNLYKKPMKWWEDKYVYTLCDLKNKVGETIPKFTTCVITGKYRGFNIKWPEKGIRIWRIRPIDLEITTISPKHNEDIHVYP